MLVEHARSTFGIEDATHAEYGTPGTPIVTLLECSLADASIELAITPGSQLETLYAASAARELTTCNYGLAPAFAYIADAGGMRVAAIDDTGEVRAIECPDHPFFVATLYQPQLTSAPGEPHPIWRGFLDSVAKR